MNEMAMIDRHILFPVLQLARIEGVGYKDKCPKTDKPPLSCYNRKHSYN